LPSRGRGKRVLKTPSIGLGEPEPALPSENTGHRGLLDRADLRTTPAMAAQVTERLWEIGDIVDVLKACEATP